MSKDLPEVKPEYPDDNLAAKITAKNIFHAPQPALPVADETAFGTVSGGGVNGAQIPTLNNMRSRIDNIETALIKLGLLRHS